ncbi:hypothetical protein scyTo_0004242, partial [Scyliorhinus torazame]|nr:hypothetical protein [Scyliorhinus torazame]
SKPCHAALSLTTIHSRAASLSRLQSYDSAIPNSWGISTLRKNLYRTHPVQQHTNIHCGRQ